MHHTAKHRAEILVPGVQTHLNGIANKGNVVLLKGEFFTRGDPLLQFHQTDGMAPYTDNTLSDAVLDLDTWIDFEKVGLPLLIDQKLDRGRAAQMDGSAQAQCISANALQGCLAPTQAGNTRCRSRRIELRDLLGNRLGVQGHLNKFLIPMILQRAITRRKVHDASHRHQRFALPSAAVAAGSTPAGHLCVRRLRAGKLPSQTTPW